MVRMFLILVMLVSLANAISLNQVQKDSAVEAVKLYGYKCDSADSVRYDGVTITVVCDKFRYKYEIVNKGGHWNLKVIR